MKTMTKLSEFVVLAEEVRRSMGWENPLPGIEITSKITGGYYTRSKHAIVLPVSLLTQGWVYQASFLIHELCHGSPALATGRRPAHGADFKNEERRALKFWGWIPEYMPAYIRSIYDIYTGVTHNLNIDIAREYKRAGKPSVTCTMEEVEI